MTGEAPLTVRVRYFALLRERIGVAEESVELDRPDFDALHAALAARHGAAADELRAASVRIALNDVLLDAPPARLAAGDVVAFLPPVTGG